MPYAVTAPTRKDLYLDCQEQFEDEITNIRSRLEGEQRQIQDEILRTYAKHVQPKILKTIKQLGVKSCSAVVGIDCIRVYAVNETVDMTMHLSISTLGKSLSESQRDWLKAQFSALHNIHRDLVYLDGVLNDAENMARKIVRRSQNGQTIPELRAEIEVAVYEAVGFVEDQLITNNGGLGNESSLPGGRSIRDTRTAEGGREVLGSPDGRIPPRPGARGSHPGARPGDLPDEQRASG